MYYITTFCLKTIILKRRYFDFSTLYTLATVYFLEIYLQTLTSFLLFFTVYLSEYDYKFHNVVTDVK